MQYIGLNKPYQDLNVLGKRNSIKIAREQQMSFLNLYQQCVMKTCKIVGVMVSVLCFGGKKPKTVDSNSENCQNH